MRVSNVQEAASADLRIFSDKKPLGSGPETFWHINDNWLAVLGELEKRGRKYRAVLNINVSLDVIWQERVLQALCGSRSNVKSILTSDKRPEIVVPMGTVFSGKAATSQAGA